MKLEGWLNVNKPSGLTSYQVISQLKRYVGPIRIGHAGTLDPLATGVLPVALGKATRTVEFMHRFPKTYVAEIELGVTTDTYDTEGEIIATNDPSLIDSETVEETLKGFIGAIEQIPPAFSALKQNGRSLYELARRGEAVQIAARPVFIHHIKLIEFNNPLVNIEAKCGSGTYIRSLAHDLGAILGVGAHLKNLKRVEYGEFNIKDSVALETIYSIDDIINNLLPLELALTNLPVIELDAAAADKIICGVIPIEVASSMDESGVYKLHQKGRGLVAVADNTGEKLRLKVFAQRQII